MRVRIVDPGPAQYGVLNLYAQQLGEAYEHFGHQLVQQAADLTLSFTTLPESCEGVQILVDHPFLRQISPGAQVACVDRTHVKALRDRHDISPFFLPHAGLTIGDPGGRHADRDIDVLFAGGFEDPALYAPLPNVKPLDLQKGGALFIQRDRHIRFSRRQQVLQVLGAAGFAVDVWGMGWHALEEREPHRFHGPVAIEELLSLYRRAKIVLHIGPNFPDGSHERVFSAQLAGAAVMLDRNPYWEETLTGCCGMYEFSQLDALPDLVRELLNDRGRRSALAEAGRAEALANHTWVARIRTSPLLRGRDRRS